jgi:hypothetical protein
MVQTRLRISSIRWEDCLRNNDGGFMKIRLSKIKTFKIKNRRGYAAIFANHLTEGASGAQAVDRMVKALRRSGIQAA